MLFLLVILNMFNMAAKHTKGDFHLYNETLNYCCVGVQILNFTITNLEGNRLQYVNSELWLLGSSNRNWTAMESIYLKTNPGHKVKRKHKTILFSV